MHTLNFDKLNAVLEQMGEKKINPQPIFFYDYLKRVLKEDRERFPVTYPREIRIAKDVRSLIAGDYEPARIIKLDKPVMSEDGETPMWGMDSSKQAYLRFGYKDLDARVLSDVCLSSDLIHAFIGGSSGQGKSVTVNSIIGSLCYEYAPWEIALHLSDAKIVEFKKYGVGHRIPHIASIAATEDADFVLSVLARAHKEMTSRQKVWGSAQVSDLPEFRKKYNLVLPRVAIIMDEVESTFRMAGKRAGEIAYYIDEVARLGRATGFHILMLTQNMTSDIPASAMGQVKIRGCLGATEKVSTAVLGNLGATYNFGKKGRLIINTEAAAGGNTAPYNVTYQTPFLTGENFEHEMKFLEEKGKEVGFAHKLAFYDEEAMFLADEFDKLANKAHERMRLAKESDPKKPTICLGYPAFVTSDADEMYKITLDHKDVENILVCSVVAEKQSAHLRNIARDLKRCGYILQYLSTDLNQAEYIPNLDVCQEVRAATEPAIAGLSMGVRKRLLLLEIEKSVDYAQPNKAVIEKQLKEDGVPATAWNNELFLRRITVFNSLIRTKDWEDVKNIMPDLSSLYAEYVKANCIVERLTADKFKPGAFFIGDLSKIVGFGRDNKDKLVNDLKKAMQDACRVNILFVLFTRSFDGLNSLNSGLRYVIFDNPDKRDYNRVKADEPRELKPNLALMFDNIAATDAQKKFKRTLLFDERKSGAS